jgi:hypothetical protein
MKYFPPRLVMALALVAIGLPASAQETATVPTYVPEFGTMWTFDAPPLDYWQMRYDFSPSQEWLDHLRLSSVRLPGCSSSFVSEDGLVMTNHHCARSCVAAVSPPETNYLRTGFVAETRGQEIQCPNMYVDQLVSSVDVTDRVRESVTATADAERVAQRDAAVAQVRAQCEEESGLRCQVVPLYNGGMYSLYTYRRYDDLRLVMAPELEISHFGGDPDNFTYPRFSLDVTFLRAYENGQPVQPEHHLEWSEGGAVEDEVTFIVGNPGSTGRLLTLAQMEYLRDVDYPARLAGYATRMEILHKLSEASPEAARRYETQILGLENSQKAVGGYLTGLLDESIMKRKLDFENDFRARIEAVPDLQERYGAVWDEIADAQLELATFATPNRYYAVGGSTLLSHAINLVRLAGQEALPEDERLPGWGDQRLERTRAALLRDQEIDEAQEHMQLVAWLSEAQRELGGGDALVRLLVGDRTPEEAADYLIESSQLLDLEQRTALVEGGLDALNGCTDPMVMAVRELEPQANGYVRRAATLQTAISANGEKLGEAIYAAYGKALPPDATFTLRISDGVVKGFPMNGTIAPYKTSFYGLFARSAEFDDQPPFQLPERWKERESLLDMKTPFNFVSTGDIIGGNSGSPVVNRAGEVVGLVFDGNIQMLPNRFIFTDEVSRSVSVHSMAIIEALRKIYDASHIADEIQGVGRR